MTKILTAEQKLRNVAAIVKRYSTPTRTQNGRGRMPSYSVDKHTIAFAALALADLIEAYLDGKLSDEIDDEVPF